MTRTSTSHWPCSIARSLDVLGDTWTLLILRECFYGSRRFDQFVDRLGIGRATLTARLRRLVEEDLLSTERYSDHANRVEYQLTDKGRATLPILAVIMRWGDDWLATPEGPPVDLLDPKTGQPVRALVVDENTGEPLSTKVEVRPRSRDAIAEAERRMGGAG